MKRRIIDILLVTIGSFIASVGYNSLLVKNNIASGGVGGLAISLNALFGWNNANFVLATTIPLLILLVLSWSRSSSKNLLWISYLPNFY